MALPTRGTRTSFMHGWEEASPAHQDAGTSVSCQPDPPGGRPQEQEDPQPRSLCSTNCNHRKLGQNEMAENMSEMKKQDKTPDDQLNEMETGSLP